MTKKELLELKKDFLKEAKASDWCELAETIIALEYAMRIEKKRNVLKVLGIKLEIYEAEKATRVFKSFDMNFFLNRDLELLSDELFSEEEF